MAYQTFKLNQNAASTFKGTHLESAQSVDFALNSSSTTGNSDGNSVVQAVLVDDIVGDFTVNLSDGKLAASFTPGDAGELILRAIVRENAGGANGTTDFTITIANAVVTSVNGTNPRSGEGSGTITFQACANNNGSIWAIS